MSLFQTMTGQPELSNTAIYGGLNSKNYLINGRYVLREKLKIIDRFYDPTYEALVERTVAAKGLSVPLIHFDEKTGNKITQYIPGVSYLKSPPTWKSLDLILQKIDDLHRLQTPIIKPFDGVKRLEYYRLLSRAESTGLDEASLLNDASAIERLFPSVLSHNDLVKGNMLFTEETLFLIDYEYAGYNSPLFDLISLISENDIQSPNLIQRMFNRYFSHQKSPTKVQFDRYMLFVDALWYYWAQAMYRQTKESIYLTIANSKRERLQRR